MLPLLYLHGVSSPDVGPTLETFLGSDAGLAAATITRLAAQWQDEATELSTPGPWQSRTLSTCASPGSTSKVRLEQDTVCLLVMTGARADGTKELIALADGFGESSESWADLLRSARHACSVACGRPRARILEDGPPGVFFRDQRAALLVSTSVATFSPRYRVGAPRSKAAPAEIYNAEDRDHALQAAKTNLSGAN